MRIAVTLFAIALLGGCASVASLPRPTDYYNTNSPANNEPLFAAAGAPTEWDIEHILNYQVKLPQKNRIAILRLSGNNYWQNYSNDFNVLTESIASGFVAELRSSPRVYDASFLPSLLIPEKRTVPFLREAAARYQADLILAYRTKCSSYEKYKMIDANETRAYCAIEAVLLDVRSGIVPFTVVASNDVLARKLDNELNFAETVRKAELQAEAKSLAEIARQLNAFIVNIPVLER